MSLAEQIQLFENQYFDSLNSVEDDFIERLIKYLRDNYVKAGKLEQVKKREISKVGVNISNAATRFLGVAGYASATEDFLGRFTDVELETIKELNDSLKLNQKAIKEIFEASPARLDFLNRTEQNLLRSGVGSQYLEGLKNTIMRSVTRGTPFTSLVRELETQYTEKGLLTSRVRTIANDSLNFYNGVLDEAIEVELDIKHFKYVGGLITTTRPFCEHMTSDVPKIFTHKELGKALDEFCPNGLPSRTPTKNIKGKTTTKGSGMIVGTVVDNFSIYKGGYGCRHRKLPVAVTEDEKARIERKNS